MSEQKTYLSKVQESDSGQVIVDFPPELFEQLNWKSGDILVWAALPGSDGFVVSKLEQ
jgi:hypothetical protein